MGGMRGAAGISQSTVKCFKDALGCCLRRLPLWLLESMKYSFLLLLTSCLQLSPANPVDQAGLQLQMLYLC